MSLHYDFPVIYNIDDVLPHIEGSDEFIVVKKDGYTVINYVSMIGDAFPTVEPANYRTATMRRECRGLIFDTATGGILARRYHKFFNVGERPDVVADLDKRHVILEKLDGSMVSPLWMKDGSIRWTTKMGITDTAMQAEAFIAVNPHYEKLARYCIQHTHTPIFEWCSMGSRIVLPYPEDKLVLTAIRCNITGEYVLHKELQIIGADYNVPVVQAVTVDDTSDISKVIEFIRAQEDAEGVVVRWDDGHMAKIKSDWYVTLHRAKDEIRNERLVARVVIEDRVDDLIPILQEEDANRLIEYRKDFWKDTWLAAATIMNHLKMARQNGTDRKTFALTSALLSPPIRSCIFHHWDETGDDLGVKVYEWLRNFILKNTTGNSMFERVRPILKTATWSK